MQTSVVIGAYQFVGFHITKYLLDQGEEVLGVDWEDREGDILEKEMEIGRNSNFLYIPIHKLNHISLEQQKTIYVSCYDLSQALRDNKQEILSGILSFLTASRTNPSSRVVVLLPLANDLDAYHALLQVVEDSEMMKIVFLPTIYGPWQSETMSFEAAIRQKELSVIEKVIKTEDKDDALFVSDITDAIVKVTASDEKKIQLQSEDRNQWFECAKLLWKDEFIQLYVSEESSRVVKGFLYTVKNKTTPIEGISLQKRHFQRLQLMKKWRENE